MRRAELASRGYGGSGRAAGDRNEAPAGAEGLVVLRPTRRAGRRNGASVALRCAGPVALLGMWWLASTADWVSEQTLASPAQVGAAFWSLAASGELWRNVSASLARALSGLACGVTIGLGLGVTAGLYRLGDELIDPNLQMLRTVPFLALAPLLIVWFGIGESSKVILITIATAMPMYLNTHSGVRNTDAKVLEAARVFGLRGNRLVREIVLPGALPALLVGLRLSLGVSLLALIVVEQFNAPRGIGFMMTSAQQFFQTDVLVVCILLYAVWGLLADLTVRLLERVALARALVRRPQLLLLDEPFAALDALTRIKMQELVAQLCRAHRPAVLLVTHDVDEAILLADRVAVLVAGRIELDITVPLDRPRMRGVPGFAELRRRLLHTLGVIESVGGSTRDFVDNDTTGARV